MEFLGFTLDVKDKLIISVFPDADQYNENDFIEKLSLIVRFC